MVVAQADPECEPASAEPIQCRGLPGDFDRPAPGEWCDHRADPDAFGSSGNRRQCDPRIGHVDDRLTPAHVIPHEHSVPAGLLGLCGQIGDKRGIRELVEQRQEQARAHEYTTIMGNPHVVLTTGSQSVICRLSVRPL